MFKDIMKKSGALLSLLAAVLLFAGVGSIDVQAKEYTEGSVEITELKVGDKIAAEVPVANTKETVYYKDAYADIYFFPADSSRAWWKDMYVVAIREYEGEDGVTYPLYVFSDEAGKEKYKVSCTTNEPAACNLTINRTYSAGVEAGETVRLSLELIKGFEFVGWEITGGVTIGEDHTFIMPAGDVEIKAIVERVDETEYTIKLNSIGRGTATVRSHESEEPGTVSMKAKAGDILQFSSEAEDGYSPLDWEIIKGDVTIGSGGYFVIMPGEDVEVNALFTDGTQKSIDINSLKAGDVVKALDGMIDGTDAEDMDAFGFYVQIDGGDIHDTWEWEPVDDVTLDNQYMCLHRAAYGMFYLKDLTFVGAEQTTWEDPLEGHMEEKVYKFTTGSTGGKEPGTVEKGETTGTAGSAVTMPSNENVLKDAVLTAEEKTQVNDGTDVTIWMAADDITKSVSAEDKALVEGALPSGSTVGMYLDLNLYKQLDGQEPERVTELGGAVEVSVKVQEALKNTDAAKERIYRIVRVHEGKADVLDGTYDAKAGIFTFKTDRFSTYALIYQDVDAKADTNTDNSGAGTQGTAAGSGSATPKTGDAAQSSLWVLLMAGAAAAVVCMRRKRAGR